MYPHTLGQIFALMGSTFDGSLNQYSDRNADPECVGTCRLESLPPNSATAFLSECWFKVPSKVTPISAKICRTIRG